MKSTLKPLRSALWPVLFLMSCQSPPQKPDLDLKTRSDSEVKGAKITAVRAFSRPKLPSEAQLIQDSGLLEKQIGYVLYDPEDGRVLTERNSNRLFIPSSVGKILSTGTALKILGPNYRFKTTLSYEGKIVDHTLTGNLYLKGTGDPLLTSSDLMSLAVLLRKKGILKVEGKFYYDETFLEVKEVIDETKDDYATHNVGISALSSEFNLITVRWKSTQDPSVTQAYSTPDFPMIELGLLKSSPGWGPSVSYQKGDKKDQWLLSPSSPKEGKQNVPVKKPGYFTSYQFKKFAEFDQISLPDPESGVTPKKRLRFWWFIKASPSRIWSRRSWSTAIISWRSSSSGCGPAPPWKGHRPARVVESNPPMDSGAASGNQLERVRDGYRLRLRL